MTGTAHRTWRIGIVAAALYAWVGISVHGIDRPQRSRITGARTLPG